MKYSILICLLLAGMAGQAQLSSPTPGAVCGSTMGGVRSLYAGHDSTRMDTTKVVLEIYGMNEPLTDSLGGLASSGKWLGYGAFYSRWDIVSTIKIKGWAVIPETKLSIMSYEQGQWIATGRPKFLTYNKQDSVSNVLQFFDKDAAGNPINW